ncbi:MAG: hypothetical protein KatS3mg060_2639 [Dehalococcoidia bacterium]|nr:MAG: hypothetical protein KatS3mg060_2639 [Dehalococcoidia bacterium]
MAEQRAALDVWAADIQFEASDTSNAVEPLDDGAKVANAFTNDVDDHGRAPARPARGFLGGDALYADSLEADRVEHAGRRLEHAWSWIATARLGADRFADDRAELVAVDQPVVFGAVPEGA